MRYRTELVLGPAEVIAFIKMSCAVMREVAEDFPEIQRALALKALALKLVSYEALRVEAEKAGRTAARVRGLNESEVDVLFPPYSASAGGGNRRASH